MTTQAQLTEIYDRYRVTPRRWLQPEVHYAANGEALFSTNPGSLVGPVRIKYAEDGELDRFVMAVDQLTAEHHPGHGAGDSVFVFVNGLPVPGQPGTFTIAGTPNRCTRLEFSNQELSGRVAQDEVIASGGQTTVDFRPFRTVVRLRAQDEPRYWAVPLLNFVSGFGVVAPELHDHPLRTRITSEIEPLEGDLGMHHANAYRQGNRLIPFLCEGELGFIEPLPDYEARAACVTDGETRVTAVMVGRLPEGADLGDRSDWFPSDLIALLGLATGRRVGVPFVELRAASGGLVARMHVRIGTPSSRRRVALIDENFDRSTGALLTAFLASRYRGETWLRVAVGHLLRSLTGDLTVDDRIGHLCRAAEGLSIGLGLSRPRPLEVSEATRKRTTQALAEFKESLDAIARVAPEQDQERLERWKSSMSNAAVNRPPFPTQLLALVEHANLPDAKWLAEFTFRLKVGGGEVPWATAAGRYRNRIVHSAFIDFDEYDIDNTIPFVNHLSDVLVRVVFSLLGFKGRYKPVCGLAGMALHETPDWPRPDLLTAEGLSYVR